MRAKEWLKAQGHIAEVTRGRIRTEHHLLLQEAHASGVEFSDWNPNRTAVMVTETTSATGETVETVHVHRIDGYQSNGEIAELAPYRYNHDTHHAVEDESGKTRSLREVCANCRVSLVQCTCGNPHVIARNGQGHVAVSIVAGASKLHKGNIWDK